MSQQPGVQVLPSNSTTLPTRPHTPQQSTVLTNHQFYMRCVRVGSTAKTAVREFLALLPEAEDRQIYLDHGMKSIFEFAHKLGGVSKEQVQRVLQLKTRFKDLLVMDELLTSGEISVHKLARVASVVTPETQEFWASKAQLLSSQALATLVRDSVHMHSVNPNKTVKISTTRVEKVPQSEELILDPDVKQELLELQNKGLNLNQLLREMLEYRKHQIQTEKQQAGNELQEKQLKQPLFAIRNGGQQSNSRASRYIPVKVKRVLKQEFGTKCAHSNCTNVSVNIHHTRRFSVDSSADPLYLAPLCKYHHEIAHSIDVNVLQKRKLGSE